MIYPNQLIYQLLFPFNHERRVICVLEMHSYISLPRRTIPFSLPSVTTSLLSCVRTSPTIRKM